MYNLPAGGKRTEFEDLVCRFVRAVGGGTRLPFRDCEGVAGRGYLCWGRSCELSLEYGEGLPLPKGERLSLLELSRLVC